MFFFIGRERQLNFPAFYKHQNFYVNVDNGWHQTTDSEGNTLIYKGYADSLLLADAVFDISTESVPAYSGNFCVIKLSTAGIEIKTNHGRTFPLWYQENYGLTNLYPLDEKIWADTTVALTPDLGLVKQKYQLLTNIKFDTLDFDSVIDGVDRLLTEKFIKFNQNYGHLPLRVFLTGGVDTTLLYSYVLKLGFKHELVRCLHTDLDYFYLKNHGYLHKLWGYQQIHHWSEPCVLLSGTPGDEFTVRNPVTANMIMQYHGSSVLELMQKNSDSLHSNFFIRYKQQLKDLPEQKFFNLGHAIKQAANINANDFQHWHLGNTLTWTPLRDFQLFNTIARLEKDSLGNHIMNSTLQIALIEKNNPQLLEIMSKEKNHLNYFENLTNIL